MPQRQNPYSFLHYRKIEQCKDYNSQYQNKNCRFSVDEFGIINVSGLFPSIAKNVLLSAYSLYNSLWDIDLMCGENLTKINFSVSSADCCTLISIHRKSELVSYFYFLLKFKNYSMIVLLVAFSRLSKGSNNTLTFQRFSNNSFNY